MIYERLLAQHDSRHNVIVDTLSYNLFYESAL